MGSLPEPAPASSSSTISNVRKKVWVLIAVFATLLVVQVALSSMFMESAWGLSAYQRGVAEWTARRQAAVDALVDSLSGRPDGARERFEEAMRGLEAFEAARGALFGDPGQGAAAAEGLVRGGLRADEAAAVVHLAQSVPTFPRGDALYEAWQEADRAVDRLETIAESVFTKADESALSDGQARALTRTVRSLEEELGRIEARFGRELTGSREILRRRMRVQQITGSAVLVLLAVGAGIWTARRLERDAAERRAAEEALRESRERLREIVEHSTNLFYSHTADHELTYISPQTRAFFDCEPEEALVRWTELVTDHPVNQKGMDHTERALATGERQPVYELELCGVGGRTIWVEVNEAPVVRDDGSVTMVGALTDITERRRVEAERERLKERLRLSQKLEAVGRLAGGVAHDFNNLLTAILGYCDLLEAKMDGRGAGMEEVREIRRAGQRAGTLTRQLLAFSRKQMIDPQVLDLDRVIERSGQMIRRLIPESIELEWRLESGPARIRADATQIEQLLMNLAINARDAMGSGGHMTVSSRRERLETARRGDLFEVVPGDYVLLRVADTGSGMDADVLEHAFEPFYTTKPSGEGTGLGLATVYGIVKQNRGYIWVDSEPGRGTTFSIYFPSVSAEDRGAEETPGGESPDRDAAGLEARGGTVLLVEDEDSVRHLVREILSRRGYTVIEARDARHARDAVRDRMAEVDLLLTDLVMPGMPGEDLARALLEEKPELAVVYITGYSEGVLNADGLFGDASHLLLKPFTAEQLIATVRDALDPEVQVRRALGTRS